MSFENNDINKFPLISRSNYEEYFLLYVDEELAAAEQKAVEDFVAENPDLKMELDSLLSTKISPEAMVFDKEELSAGYMRLHEMNESLLLYLDDELPLKEQEGVTQLINNNQEYSRQYQLLQKTKLDASEQISFPHKQELYHKSAPVPMFNQQLRIAAIILILLTSGLFIWFSQEKETDDVPTVAHHNKPQTKKDTGTSLPQKNNQQELLPEVVSPVQENIALQKPAEKSKKKPVITSNQIQPEGIAKRIAVKKKVPVQSLPQEIVPKKEEDISRLQPEENIALNTKPLPVVPDKKNLSSPVTPALVRSYNNKQDANAVTMVAAPASADENSDTRKTPLKGLLRKATRFIERKTNVNPINEDGELLIGAVSLKL